MDDDSDDDGQMNTYDHNDSFLDNADDSSSSSSYGEGSGDSDWKPGEGMDEDGDQEDVNELLLEARGFLRNKKMPKPV